MSVRQLRLTTSRIRPRQSILLYRVVQVLDLTSERTALGSVVRPNGQTRFGWRMSFLLKNRTISAMRPCGESCSGFLHTGNQLYGDRNLRGRR
jgi:hypothetical protein